MQIVKGLYQYINETYTKRKARREWLAMYKIAYNESYYLVQATQRALWGLSCGKQSTQLPMAQSIFDLTL